MATGRLRRRSLMPPGYAFAGSRWDGFLNADSTPDLAIANYYSDNVSVLMNHGDGTFATQLTYATGAAPCGLVVGDLDADGKADIATANNHINGVSVLINTGDGTFATQVPYATGSGLDGPRSIAMGNVTGDHKPDLLVANYGFDTDGGRASQQRQRDVRRAGHLSHRERSLRNGDR